MLVTENANDLAGRTDECEVFTSHFPLFFLGDDNDDLNLQSTAGRTGFDTPPTWGLLGSDVSRLWRIVDCIKPFQNAHDPFLLN